MTKLTDALDTLPNLERAEKSQSLDATPDEIAGIGWWNSMTEQSRKSMLESPAVRDDPTPARCWQVFGPSRA